MHNRWLNLLTLLLTVLFIGCTAAPRYGIKSGTAGSRGTRNVVFPKPGYVIEGTASFYSFEFAGRKTANGEIFDPNGITAAHRNWPFGTIVEVTNLQTNRKVEVRINDRGPFTSCIIDLSYGAAQSIGMVQNTKVKLRVVSVGAIIP
ncbi:MAG: septal ring lytic transglycosylase RlpA family protein [bacterium]|nr:septal ring lytic transglycosylase RlpA family protein [bacterium]